MQERKFSAKQCTSFLSSAPQDEFSAESVHTYGSPLGWAQYIRYHG